MLKRLYPVLLPGIALVVLYCTIPFFDYAFTDEAHLLWHHKDGANFQMFLGQGRIITALIIQRSFASITTIAQLKWLRIISFAGWLIALVLWRRTLSAWADRVSMHPSLITFMTIFLACSPTVAISIGWAACIELSFAFVTALLSGHLFFTSLSDHQKRIPLRLTFSLVLAMISLFTYQPMFGGFLLPFFMLFVVDRKYTKTILAGIAAYLIVSLLYYFLFKYSLRLYDVQANNRTEIATNWLDKLSFFISQPLPQAFSLNFLYNLSGIFSQAFFPVMLAGWIVTVLLIYKKQGAKENLLYIGGVLGLLILIYLPGLLTKENFASYRTMLPLNLAGTFLLFDAGLRIVHIRKPRWKQPFLYIACTIILLAGWYNFNINFIDPLRSEYTAVRTHFSETYTPATTKAILIRPSESLFKDLYGIHHYKDEFGVPSTYKDWTPDPLIRQLVLEATGSHRQAEGIQVINVTNGDDRRPDTDAAALFFDVDSLMKKKIAK